MSCEINFKETAVQRRSQRPNSGNHTANPPPHPYSPTLLHLPPPCLETPDAHAVSGSLNISFSELVSLLRLTAFFFFRRGGGGGGCCVLKQASQQSYGNLLNHVFQTPSLSHAPT